MDKKHQTAETNRRIDLIWVESEPFLLTLKRKVYELCIVPVATYGFETMTLTDRRVSRLITTQREIWKEP